MQEKKLLCLDIQGTLFYKEVNHTSENWLIPQKTVDNLQWFYNQGWIIVLTPSSSITQKEYDDFRTLLKQKKTYQNIPLDNIIQQVNNLVVFKRPKKSELIRGYCSEYGITDTSNVYFFDDIKSHVDEVNKANFPNTYHVTENNSESLTYRLDALKSNLEKRQQITTATTSTTSTNATTTTINASSSTSNSNNSKFEYTESKLVIETINLKQTPTVTTLLSSLQYLEVSFPDWHAHAYRFYILLEHNNIARLSPQLQKDYSQIYDKDVEDITAEDINKIFTIMNAVVVVHTPRLIRSMGDEVYDRGKNCYFVILTFRMLQIKKIPFKSICSNHTIELIRDYENKKDYGNSILGGFARSGKNLQRLIEKKIITREHVDDLIKNYLLPPLDLLSYSLSADKKSITIFTHAPIHGGFSDFYNLPPSMMSDIEIDSLEIIQEITIKWNIEFRDNTAVELGKTIDEINTVFQSYKDQGKISTLFSQAGVAYALYRGRCDSSVKDPFIRLIWNRAVPSVIPKQKKYRNYLIQFCAAHTGSRVYSLDNRIILLDKENSLGKSEDLIEGTCTTWYSRESSPAPVIKYSPGHVSNIAPHLQDTTSHNITPILPVPRPPAKIENHTRISMQAYGNEICIRFCIEFNAYPDNLDEFEDLIEKTFPNNQRVSVTGDICRIHNIYLSFNNIDELKCFMRQFDNAINNPNDIRDASVTIDNSDWPGAKYFINNYEALKKATILAAAIPIDITRFVIEGFQDFTRIRVYLDKKVYNEHQRNEFRQLLCNTFSISTLNNESVSADADLYCIRLETLNTQEKQELFLSQFTDAFDTLPAPNARIKQKTITLHQPPLPPYVSYHTTSIQVLKEGIASLGNFYRRYNDDTRFSLNGQVMSPQYLSLRIHIDTRVYGQQDINSFEAFLSQTFYPIQIDDSLSQHIKTYQLTFPELNNRENQAYILNQLSGCYGMSVVTLNGEIKEKSIVTNNPNVPPSAKYSPTNLAVLKDGISKLASLRNQMISSTRTNFGTNNNNAFFYSSPNNTNTFYSNPNMNQSSIHNNPQFNHYSLPHPTPQPVGIYNNTQFNNGATAFNNPNYVGLNPYSFTYNNTSPPAHFSNSTTPRYNPNPPGGY